MLAGLGLVLVLAGCGPSATQPAGPIEIADQAVCALDGMLLADYPGPRAQIHYQQGEPDFFCDTLEMFALYLEPEQARAISALYVQDMSKTPWDKPQGHWMDARQAFYVHGSSRHGAMGPTLASFSSRETAEAFAREFGGRVLRFEEVTAEIATLDGGALHDRAM